MTASLIQVSAQASMRTDRISQKTWSTSWGPQKGNLRRTACTRARINPHIQEAMAKTVHSLQFMMTVYWKGWEIATNLT